MCCYNLCPICQCKCTCSLNLPFGFKRNIKTEPDSRALPARNEENSKDFHLFVTFRRIGTDPRMSCGLSVRNSEAWWCEGGETHFGNKSEGREREKALWIEKNQQGTAITNTGGNRENLIISWIGTKHWSLIRGFWRFCACKKELNEDGSDGNITLVVNCKYFFLPVLQARLCVEEDRLHGNT